MLKLLQRIERLLLKRKVKNYEKVSLVYDFLMRRINYKDWADYIYDIAKERIHKDSSVLEIGSGSGRLAAHLKKKIPNITLADISREMLKKGRVKLPKVCCNMSALPFKQKFSLIFSAFDSINYLLSRKELLKFFKEVYKILDDEGVFTFDVSLERNSIRHLKDAVKGGNHKGIKFKRTSRYNEKTCIHQNIFFIDYGGEIFTEVHKQKIFPFEDYFNLLPKAGLYVAECYNAFSFRHGSENSKRVQFVVKKEI